MNKLRTDCKLQQEGKVGIKKSKQQFTVNLKQH